MGLGMNYGCLESFHVKELFITSSLSVSFENMKEAVSILGIFPVSFNIRCYFSAPTSTWWVSQQVALDNSKLSVSILAARIVHPPYILLLLIGEIFAPTLDDFSRTISNIIFNH